MATDRNERKFRHLSRGGRLHFEPAQRESNRISKVTSPLIDQVQTRRSIPTSDSGELSSFYSARAIAEQAFSRAAGAPLVSGNRVRLLINAAQNYPAWLAA